MYSENSAKLAHVKLTDVSPGDKHWEVHRAHADTIQAYYNADPWTRKKAHRVRQCAQALEFAWVQDEQTGECRIKLHNTQFCRVRHCPVCEWRKSLRWKARFYQALPQIIEQYPTSRFLFLTLTVRNCQVEELRETIRWMNHAWGKFIKRRRIARQVQGWIRATEVTKNPKDDTAHPHFHCFLMVPASYFKGDNYIKAEDWQEMWRQSLGVDYQPITNIKPVKDVNKGVKEVLKYSAKPQDLVQDQDWFLAFADQVHKLRFMASGGALKNVLKDDVSKEEMIHTDETEESADQDPQPGPTFDWFPAEKHYFKR